MGKEISFTSSHQLPSGEGDIPCDFGNGEVNGVDITNELLSNDWAKVTEFKREPTEDDLRQKGLESEAKAAGRGQWNPHGPKVGAFTLCFARNRVTIPRRRGKSYTTCPWILKDSSTSGRGNNWMVHRPGFYVYSPN